MLTKTDIQQLVKILRRHEYNYSEWGEQCHTCNANKPNDYSDDDKTEDEIRESMDDHIDSDFWIECAIDRHRERQEQGIGHKPDCAFKIMLDKLGKEE